MGISPEHLVEVNLAQSVSETDSFTLERYAQFLRNFPEDARDVLDIGCNTGRGGALLKSRNPRLRITGLDCVPDRLDKLPTGVYDGAICGFADDIALPDASFDVIVLGEIIEHIPGPSISPSLHELFRLFRLRGRILLTTPNPHYLRNRLQNKSVLLDSSHVSQHTPSSMRRKLEDASFSNIRIFGSGRLTRTLGQHFPLLSAYGSYLAMGDKW
jgi:ubiquinone/menaquinone biosynthesis C-methylase UbiE